MRRQRRKSTKKKSESLKPLKKPKTKKRSAWLREDDRTERSRHNVECIEIDEEDEGEW